MLRGRTVCLVNEDGSQRIAVELTTAEAKLVITALQRFEPYWPSRWDDLTRADLLAGIHVPVDHFVATLVLSDDVSRWSRLTGLR